MKNQGKMIKEVTMFTVICDNCGEQREDENTGICAWTDSYSADQNAMDDESWHKTLDDKHYCSKCFGGFDDEDNLIILNHKNAVIL